MTRNPRVRSTQARKKKPAHSRAPVRARGASAPQAKAPAAGTPHSIAPAFSDHHARWRPHPWHGLSAGKAPPELVNAYIEITPFDSIKYEIDKDSGYLKVDRPQLTSSLPPALYGFVPRTYCGDRVAALGRAGTQGDHDPLDICVFSERAINRAEVVVPARVIGGLRIIDRGEADDKIVAVLESDPYWKDVHDLRDLPAILRRRLEHYFLTYKRLPGEPAVTQIDKVYGLREARAVVTASLADYRELRDAADFR